LILYKCVVNLAPSKRNFIKPKSPLKEGCFVSSVKGKTTEEIIDSMVENLLGIQLDKDQRKFLRLIRKHGVSISMTKEAKNSEELQKLTDLLFEMAKDGTIPIFQIVNV